MLLNDTQDFGHLTYCTNVHSGETLPEVMANLESFLPRIKAASSPDRDMGVGLRLGAAAAKELEQPENFDTLQGFLSDGGFYVFTLNGFPFGNFHGQTIKEKVYAPDWSTKERLSYTNTLADILVGLLPDAQNGSISTVPGTFKPWANTTSHLQAIVINLVSHVAHLLGLKERTGKTISLALEPEPLCLIETIDETILFFNEHLFGAEAVSHLSKLTGFNKAQTELALRSHLSVCYDVCHAAVEFEEPEESVNTLENAGIAISKLQLSSALRINNMTPQKAALLKPFDEPVYLHQTVAKSAATLRRYCDLADALADAQNLYAEEWRIHFHVPVFLEDLTDFGTTQFFLQEILARHRRAPIASHLEVETYSWDVLPDEYRHLGLTTAISRELDWVKRQLLS